MTLRRFWRLTRLQLETIFFTTLLEVSIGSRFGGFEDAPPSLYVRKISYPKALYPNIAAGCARTFPVPYENRLSYSGCRAYHRPNTALFAFCQDACAATYFLRIFFLVLNGEGGGYLSMLTSRNFVKKGLSICKGVNPKSSDFIILALFCIMLSCIPTYYRCAIVGFAHRFRSSVCNFRFAQNQFLG